MIHNISSSRAASTYFPDFLFQSAPFINLCCWSAVVSRPTQARPWERDNRRMSFTTSSLLFQQCPACLVRLTWIVLEMGGKWQYSSFFMGCCFHDLFSIAPSILVQPLSSFFPIRLVSVHVVQPYSSIDTVTNWKKFFFNLSDRPDFYRINNLSIAVHAFAWRVLISLSEDEMLLPRYVNLSTNFTKPPFRVDMSLHVETNAPPPPAPGYAAEIRLG